MIGNFAIPRNWLGTDEGAKDSQAFRLVGGGDTGLEDFSQLLSQMSPDALKEVLGPEAATLKSTELQDLLTGLDPDEFHPPAAGAWQPTTTPPAPPVAKPIIRSASTVSATGSEGSEFESVSACQSPTKAARWRLLQVPGLTDLTALPWPWPHGKLGR